MLVFCKDILLVSLALGQRFSCMRITWGLPPSLQIWTLWVFTLQSVVFMTVLLAWSRGLLEMHNLKPHSWRQQDLSLTRFSGDFYALSKTVKLEGGELYFNSKHLISSLVTFPGKYRISSGWGWFLYKAKIIDSWSNFTMNQEA